MIESLESRSYLSVTWASYASLVKQDTAAADFPSDTGAGVTVAVIDTGVDYTQTALGGGFGPGFKVEAGYDFYSNDADPMDESGHGTGVASVIAANPYTVNGVHYQGVAPDAKIVALRVGTAESIPDADIAKALQWVIDNRTTYHINVINLSLGSGSYTSSQTESDMSSLFKTLRADGVFIVAASGNSNDQNSGPISQDGIAYPAADPNVFAVGAVDSAGLIADFAQRGDELDLLAPGVGIELVQLGGGFTSEDGTSFSSPYVAGTAALIYAMDSTVSAGDVGSILMGSGTPNRDGDNETGNTTGLLFSQLNIDSALKLTQKRTGVTSTLSLGKTFSTAVDSNGVLHVAFYNTAKGDLDYATRDIDGNWSAVQVIDSVGDVGAQMSIAVDHSGKIGIAYFDVTNTALKYAYFSGTGWSTSTLDADKFTGTSPSLAFSIDGDPYIGYYRKSGGYLRLASEDRDTKKWTLATIDGGATANVGADVSLAVGEAAASNNGFTQYDTTVALAYSDATNGNLKYARRDVDDTTATWFIGIADDTNGVGNIDLQLHNGPSNLGLQAQISYLDSSTKSIDYAYKTSETAFTVETVTSGKVFGQTQLTFNSVDAPVVAYYNASVGHYYLATRVIGGGFHSVAGPLTSGLISTAYNDRTSESTITFLNRTKTSVAASVLYDGYFDETA